MKTLDNRPQRQLLLLQALKEHGYADLSLGDLIDPELKVLVADGLVTTYPTMGAGRKAHLSAEGKRLMGVVDRNIPEAGAV